MTQPSNIANIGSQYLLGQAAVPAFNVNWWVGLRQVLGQTLLHVGGFERGRKRACCRKDLCHSDRAVDNEKITT